MEEKYVKFYKTFHKKFKNDKNLILCSKTLNDGRVVLFQIVKNHFYLILIISLFAFLFFTNTTPAQRGNTIGEIICAMGLGGDGLMPVDEVCRD